MRAVALILNGFHQSEKIDYELFLQGAAGALKEFSYQAVAAAAHMFLSGKVEREKHIYHPSTAEIANEARRQESFLKARERQAVKAAAPKAKHRKSSPAGKTELQLADLRKAAEQIKDANLRKAMLRFAKNLKREK